MPRKERHAQIRPYSLIRQTEYELFIAFGNYRRLAVELAFQNSAAGSIHGARQRDSPPRLSACAGETPLSQ
jgi:hypothetical protein